MEAGKTYLVAAFDDMTWAPFWNFVECVEITADADAAASLRDAEATLAR